MHLRQIFFPHGTENTLPPLSAFRVTSLPLCYQTFSRVLFGTRWPPCLSATRFRATFSQVVTRTYPFPTPVQLGAAPFPTVSQAPGYRGDPNEPRSHYYYEDREGREYRNSTPKPRRMIQSTKPNYTRCPQPASIEDEDVPEGEDPGNHNFTQSEAEQIESGRQWYLENFRRDPPSHWTPWPGGLAAPLETLNSRAHSTDDGRTPVHFTLSIFELCGPLYRRRPCHR